MSQPPTTVSKGCLGVIAFFFPPVAVFMVRGCGVDFWLNLLLFLLFWIFAMFHAMYIVCHDPQPTIISGQTYAAPQYGATGQGQGQTFMGQPVEQAPPQPQYHQQPYQPPNQKT